MNFIRSGFRIVRQNPALIFAEIAWRWAFGAAAWVLVVFTVRTIMAGVDVSAAEVALARSSNTYLIADAVVRVLVQVLPRFLAAMLIALPLLSVAWVLAATIGRTVTLRHLLSESPDRPAISLIFLNAIRAIFSLATVVAFFGTVFLVSAQIGPRTAPEVAPAYVLAWLLLAFLVGCFWGVVNWFLALAPIFIVRDGSGAWKALAASVALYRDRSRDYMAIATWFGFFRAAALLVAVVAGLATLGAGWRAALAASVVIALLYFAVADALYIARFAAYVRLVESPTAPAVAASPPVNPESSLATPLSETEPETGTPSGLS